jgi:hypothetical protein
MSANKIEVDPAVAKIQKILGEPVFCEFSDKTWRFRTNLIVVSVISLVVVLADLHIESGSSVFGLKFAGLTDNVVRSGLFWISIYLLAHFLWGAFDNFLEWRLRITGTRVAYVTTGMFASEHADYPSDPRQSTLYNWWRSQASSIGNIGKKMSDIEHELNEWIRKLREKYNSGADAMNIVNACNSIGETQRMITELKNSIKEAGETIEAKRIPASLQRFDGWFELFLRSQNLRWFLVELLFPVALALSALWLLWR